MAGDVLLLGELRCPAGFSAKKTQRDGPAELLQAALPHNLLESCSLSRVALANTNHLLLKIWSKSFHLAPAST